MSDTLLARGCGQRVYRMDISLCLLFVAAADVRIIAPVFKVAWPLPHSPQPDHFPVVFGFGCLGTPALATALHTWGGGAQSVSH